MAAPFHAVNPHVDDDEKYNSADDQDFNPEALDEEDQSSSEDEAAIGPTRKPIQHAEDVGFDNSGDEATLSKARRKQKSKSAKPSRHQDDDGEAGLIKTRAQRKAEVIDTKPKLPSGSATVDVDSLWATMSAPPPPPKLENAVEADVKSNDEANAAAIAPETDSDIVTIKRKFEFAGEVMEEEKIVSKSSAEAKLYLAEKAKELDASKPKPAPNGAKPLRRPVKRKSIFAADVSPALSAKGPKLNTLQKSKMDWAAHVDKEGIAEELDVHGRAKDNLTDRMDFLDRMNHKREQDRPR